jgi:hypothetical protein
MQTTKRPTGLRTAAPDYVTLVQQAKSKINGIDNFIKTPSVDVIAELSSIRTSSLRDPLSNFIASKEQATSKSP